MKFPLPPAPPFKGKIPFDVYMRMSKGPRPSPDEVLAWRLEHGMPPLSALATVLRVTNNTIYSWASGRARWPVTTRAVLAIWFGEPFVPWQYQQQGMMTLAEWVELCRVEGSQSHLAMAAFRGNRHAFAERAAPLDHDPGLPPGAFYDDDDE